MFSLKKSDPSQAIILAGSGRSGTTWLGNIIAANPNVRIIFEPFDYRRVPDAAHLPLRPYARPQAEYPDWSAFVHRVLCGQVQNEWINRQGNYWWTSRRLIKAIRANLMLAWMDHMFQPQIVFMTRHPCAVVLSRLKLKWQTHLDVFLQQPQLMADYLDPYVDLIRGAQTPIQKHAVMWAVENLIPLKQLPAHNWVFCTYEELVHNPDAQAERVLDALGIQKSWFTRRAIKRVSMVTRPDSALLSGRDPLTVWQYELPGEDIDEILKIVHAFGINLYGLETMPHVKTPLRGHVDPTGVQG